ncbi:MAG TPA: hypothetical protein VIW74_16465, partial [Pyrinomonadaceae bacterium]
MRRTLIITAALLITVCSVQITPAQLPIKIPKIPKPTQPKPEPTPAPSGSTAPTQPAAPQAMNASDGQPRIDKNSILITTQRGRDVGGYEARGWVPAIQYRGTGSIASGSRLSVDFTIAGKPWVSFDCTPERETEDAPSWSATCGGDSIPGGKQVTYAGPVAFTIHLRNELQGTNVTLFNGTAKVVMVPASKGATKIDNEEWYVDEDWRIPFGYVFWEKDPGHGNDEFLHVAFWVRGNTPEVEAHLFYQGKDIAKFSKPGNGAADWNPNLHRWGLIDGEFLGVYPNAPGGDEGYEPRFVVTRIIPNSETRLITLITTRCIRVHTEKLTVNQTPSMQIWVPICCTVSGLRKL